MERAGGYLNFWVDPVQLTDLTLKAIIDLGRSYGTLPKKGISVILEHTSANPNGPLHVGRARNPIIGDTVARLLKANGYDVTTEYYVNDSGMQVATLVWGYLNLERDSRSDEKPDHRYVRYYQEASALGSDAEDGIRELLREYELGDPRAIEGFKIHEEVMEGIIHSLERINVKHDSFVKESRFLRNGDVAKVVEMLKPFCKEEEGSLYHPLHREGCCLPPRQVQKVRYRHKCPWRGP
jgi:arginyl-tRNA synthetase